MVFPIYPNIPCMFLESTSRIPVEPTRTDIYMKVKDEAPTLRMVRKWLSTEKYLPDMSFSNTIPTFITNA